MSCGLSDGSNDLNRHHLNHHHHHHQLLSNGNNNNLDNRYLNGGCDNLSNINRLNGRTSSNSTESNLISNYSTSRPTTSNHHSRTDTSDSTAFSRLISFYLQESTTINYLSW